MHLKWTPRLADHVIRLAHHLVVERRKRIFIMPIFATKFV